MIQQSAILSSVAGLNPSNVWSLTPQIRLLDSLIFQQLSPVAAQCNPANLKDLGQGRKIVTNQI